jgi:hypothetical protein
MTDETIQVASIDIGDGLDASDYTGATVADLQPFVADESSVAELADFTEGDVVKHGDTAGVVTAVMEENFEWPTEDSVPDDMLAEQQPDREDDDDTEYPTLKASSDEPIYVVATEDGAQAFLGEDIEGADQDEAFGDDDADPEDLTDAEMGAVYSRVDDPYDFQEFEAAVEEMQNIPGIDDPGVGFDELPEGWDRTTVLDAWTSLGGTFTSCRAEMAGEIRSPARFCGSYKDEVLKTTSWRGRF